MTWTYSTASAAIIKNMVHVYASNVTGFASNGVDVYYWWTNLTYPYQNVVFIASNTYTISGLISGLTTCTGLAVTATDALFSTTATLAGCTGYSVTWVSSAVGSPSIGDTVVITGSGVPGYSAAVLGISIVSGTTSYTTNNTITFVPDRKSVV